jgi:hypothetical protein
MKPSRKKPFELGTSVAVAVVTSALAGCGMFSSSSESVRMQGAQSVPAAVGEVGVKPTKQGNMELAIKVDHLAPPDQVEAGTTTYVAWAEPAAGGPPQNLGALKVGEDRSGKLVTKTPARNAKISITPEAAPSVIKPNHDPVMWATVNRPQ